ncbi:actin-binding protein IPP [Drosophila eugracilis]|uniref:actin-binding protein IPP n=1 Tax=Drosophila eugracilis TaxID=29029 RepID=UPI0007E63D1B|nr:actin-binding protein IPP [Drosophila eugracilis]
MEKTTTDKTGRGMELPMEPKLKEVDLNHFRMNYEMPAFMENYTLPKKRNVLADLKKFWLESNYHDFTIRIGEHVFPCDRIVLMAYVDLVRKDKTKSELRLPENSVRPEIFPILYRWMIDQELMVKRSEVARLLMAVDYLKIDLLSEQIWRCLDRGTGSGEQMAIQLAQDALAFKDLTHLHYLMLHRISYYFLIFASSAEFLDLSAHSLATLFSSSNIRVNTEAEVFYAAIRWLTYEWPTRQTYAAEVMKKVRAARMPTELLLKLESPVDDIRVDRVLGLPDVKRRIKKGSFDQKAMDFDDGTRLYQEIYEIFDVDLSKPRLFICHNMAPYHEPKPNSPDQVFSYADFLNYLSALQSVPLDTLQLLEKPQ